MPRSALWRRVLLRSMRWTRRAAMPGRTRSGCAIRMERHGRCSPPMRTRMSRAAEARRWPRAQVSGNRARATQAPGRPPAALRPPPAARTDARSWPTKFSGLVGAYGSEEEATFLATRQVDEARHMQFYARFQEEVVAAPDVIAAHIDRARGEVSGAFRHIFDVALVDAHAALVAAPGDLPTKVRF